MTKNKPYTPFDDYLAYASSVLWPEALKDASIKVCDTLSVAEKIIKQVHGINTFNMSDAIEIARLILLENQRLLANREDSHEF